MHNHHHRRHYYQSPPPQPKKSKGRYQVKIEEMAEASYPNLRYLKEFMIDANGRQSRGHPHCTILQISMDNKTLVRTPEGNREFGQILKDFKPETTPSQTLFILEDLSTDWIEYLGSLLDIDPHFFANHLRSSEYEHNNNKTNAPVLPSARRWRNFTVLSYFKPILLESECGLNRTEMTDFNILRRMTLRHVKQRNSDKDEITIGLVTRMVCYWHRIYTGNGSWVGVLLTDPAIPSPFHIKSDLSDDEKEFRSLDWKSYGGGYVDFRPWTRVKQMSHTNPTADQCMSHDVFYYWRDAFPIKDDLKPWERTDLIVQKIALSDWMLTLALLRRDYDALRLNQFADKDADPDDIDRLLTEIASSRHLIAKCCSFARRDLVNLAIWPTEELYFSRWKGKLDYPEQETNCDWTWLYLELQHWKTDTDELIDQELRLMRALDSKRAAADSKREEQDTRALNRLSYFAAILGPLSITSGILSMGGEFAPGQANFWNFWAAWVPLSFLIVLWLWTSRMVERWGTKVRSNFVNLRTTHQE